MTNAREHSDRLARLLRTEHGAMADFLVALADFDRRRLWLDLGHASLFYYLVRELGLSAGAAQLRKTAAELLQEYPEVGAPLRDGRLCLSTICELAKVLDPENRDEVLPRVAARGDGGRGGDPARGGGASPGRGDGGARHGGATFGVLPDDASADDT